MRHERLVPAVALGVALAAVLLTLRSGDSGHRIRADFPSAVNLVRGAPVRAGGVKIGTVKSIELAGRKARVVLGIDDDDVWPLRSGTAVQIRLGGNVSYANRYVELVPGRENGRALDENALLPVRDADAPLEFDQLFNTFDTRTRAGTGALIDAAERTLGGRGPALREGLGDAGPALGEAGQTLSEATADPKAFETLITAGATTARAVASREAQLRSLIDGATTTLTTFADAGPDVRATLRALPGTLRQGRTTLARLDPSLVRLDGLVTDLAPGAARLRRVAPPLRAAIRTLRVVAPQLDATLAQVRSRGPGISRFLTAAAPQLDALRPILARLAPMTNCLRQYTPEVAGFFSSWASLATHYDAQGRMGQTNGQALPIPNGSPLTSKQVIDTFPTLRFSLVRPAGLNVGQPQYDSACGTSAAAQDPANDPDTAK